MLNRVSTKTMELLSHAQHSPHCTLRRVRYPDAWWPGCRLGDFFGFPIAAARALAVSVQTASESRARRRAEPNQNSPRPTSPPNIMRTKKPPTAKSTTADSDNIRAATSRPPGRRKPPNRRHADANACRFSLDISRYSAFMGGSNFIGLIWVLGWLPALTTLAARTCPKSLPFVGEAISGQPPPSTSHGRSPPHGTLV